MLVVLLVFEFRCYVLCNKETMITLDYAFRARNITNKPEINHKLSKEICAEGMCSRSIRLTCFCYVLAVLNTNCCLPTVLEARLGNSLMSLSLKVHESP